MKIWKLEQLKQETKVDEMVLAKAEEILKVLNVHYGDDRFRWLYLVGYRRNLYIH